MPWPVTLKKLNLNGSMMTYEAPYRDFPGGSEVKASACNAGDLGSIPGLGRSPGEGNGNPLQCSCLENPMDGGAWWTTVHRVTKSQTGLSDLTFTFTFHDDLQDLLELTPRKEVLFIIGDWNEKVESQEIPGVTSSLALEYRMKQGKV